MESLAGYISRARAPSCSVKGQASHYPHLGSLVASGSTSKRWLVEGLPLPRGTRDAVTHAWVYRAAWAGQTNSPLRRVPGIKVRPSTATRSPPGGSTVSQNSARAARLRAQGHTSLEVGERGPPGHAKLAAQESRSGKTRTVLTDVRATPQPPTRASTPDSLPKQVEWRHTLC